MIQFEDEKLVTVIMNHSHCGVTLYLKDLLKYYSKREYVFYSYCRHKIKKI